MSCEECKGQTVLFRGSGMATEYYVCSQWKKPGHLSKKEIEDKIATERMKHWPRSGRFA